MSITQDELARQLGISRKSVVRALHGQGKVSEVTRQRVLRTARELGYSEHSNQASRIMNARRYGRPVKHGVIGVMMLPVELPSRTTPFFAEFLDGIEAEAHTRGIDVFSFTFCYSQPLPRWIRERMVDGVIMLSSIEQAIERVEAVDLPAIAFMGNGEEIPGITIDNRKGAVLAIRHLVEAGHRRIAYLSLPINNYNATERFEGYLQGLRECGLHPDPTLIENSVELFRDSSAGMERLLQRTRDFTALVCYNDFMAMAAIRRLEAIGLRVPGDISVVGYDDISLHHHFHPALTSIAFDRVAMGRRALQLMVSEEHIASETFPVQLVARDSTRRLN